MKSNSPRSGSANDTAIVAQGTSLAAGLAQVHDLKPAMRELGRNRSASEPIKERRLIRLHVGLVRGRETEPLSQLPKLILLRRANDLLKGNEVRLKPLQFLVDQRRSF